MTADPRIHNIARNAMRVFCISQTICTVLTTYLINIEIFMKFIPINFCS